VNVVAVFPDADAPRDHHRECDRLAQIHQVVLFIVYRIRKRRTSAWLQVAAANSGNGCDNLGQGLRRHGPTQIHTNPFVSTRPHYNQFASASLAIAKTNGCLMRYHGHSKSGRARSHAPSVNHWSWNSWSCISTSFEKGMYYLESGNVKSISKYPY
jgi:hypothetical protein